MPLPLYSPSEPGAGAGAGAGGSGAQGTDPLALQVTALVGRFGLYHHPSVDSTQAALTALLSDPRRDPEDPTQPWPAVVSDEQTGGRGRHGRAWTSPPGNLYLSYAVPRVAISQAEPVRGIFLAAILALHACVQPLVQPQPRLAIKWPNDLLVDQAKISGLLIEASGPWFLVGQGVNLISAPDGTAYPATHLRAAGISPPAPLSLAKRLLEEATGALGRVRTAGEVQAMHQRWDALLAGKGREITLTTRDGQAPVRGIFSHVDDNGHLVLQLSPSRRQTFSIGDVFGL